MPAKNGNIRVILKVVLAVAVVVAGGILALNSFRATAVVATVKRGPAADIVTGSVVVHADHDLQDLKSELGGRVVSCEALNPGTEFKKGDILLKLDTTDQERTKDQAIRDFETAQRRLEVPFANNAEWKAAKEKLNEAIRQQQLAAVSADDVKQLQGQLDAIARANSVEVPLANNLEWKAVNEKLAEALGRQKAAAARADDVKRLQEELDEIARHSNPERIVASEKLTTAERMAKLGGASADQVTEAKRALEAIDLKLRFEDFDRAKDKIGHETSMETQQRAIDKMTIRALDDGLVQGVMVAPGALIGANQTVATFYSNTRVVLAKVSEDNISKVKLGNPGKIRLTNLGSAESDATVTKILPFADADTQLYTVYLSVKLKTKDLEPGSTGEVTITVDERANQPLIPRRALGLGDYVFVVTNGNVEKRKVDPGFIGLNKAEVKGGLEPGEQVIIEDLDEFRDGQRVRVKPID